MKLAFIAATLLTSLSVSAFAQTYSYSCKFLPDRTDEVIQIEVTQDSMVMLDQYDGIGRGGRGKVVFTNNGLQGGKGKMKDRLNFTVDWDRSEVAPGEISEFFLSPELTSGGFKLRNGSKGGYMTFAGQGFSWESYMCFAKK